MAVNGDGARHKRSRTTSHASRTLPRTEIFINVYDLLPPGRLSSFLWAVGGSLLHSGIVINDREYAYGGHGRRNITGVYYTKPRLEPPGGTFRCSVLHGVSFRTPKEIDAAVKEVSDEFLGPRYNLLTNNCNHFTSALCARLTGKPAPGWLNRAASIGVALPCVVPKEWVAPPDHETAEGELLDDDDEEEDDDSMDGDHRDAEHAAMLQRDKQQRHAAARQQSWNGHGAADGTDYNNDDEANEDNDNDDNEQHARSMAGGRRIPDTCRTPPPRTVDTSGRALPVAERAPLPHR